MDWYNRRDDRVVRWSRLPDTANSVGETKVVHYSIHGASLTSELVRDFLSSLLEWDANRRWTSTQALHHTWIRCEVPLRPDIGRESASVLRLLEGSTHATEEGMMHGRNTEDVFGV